MPALGGFTSVHQFVRVGAYSFTGLGTVLTQDLPPYILAAGNTARPHGLNLRELKRGGFPEKTILALKHAYKLVYRSGLSLEGSRGADRAANARCTGSAEFSRFYFRTRSRHHSVKTSPHGKSAMRFFYQKK